jgi:hypothetical protein
LTTEEITRILRSSETGSASPEVEVEEMIFRKEIRGPIIGLLVLSLGGWMLHFRIHPITANPSNLVPFFIGLMGILVTPLLFSYRKTVIVAYLLNGLSVLIGTLAMATFSLYHLPDSLTLINVIFRTILGDILILFSKLFVGQMILMHFHPSGLGRMFTVGWWIRHFFYFLTAFSLGHFLWR